jgi:LysM repeat protein
MKKFCLTLILVIGLGMLLSAAPLYIMYDEACMDRLTYVSANSDNDEPYIVYQVNTAPGEKIILEVGTESTNPQDYKPSLVYNCGNAVFDQKLVNAINSKIDQAFMVVKKGRRYFVSPISFAALYIYTEDVLFYDSPKYRFQFDRRNGAVGENIAYKSPKAEVTFDGRMDRECTGTFIFRQYSEFEGNPHTDILLVPEIGVVEERSGINIEDALDNTLKLDEVNGKDLDRYIRDLCKDAKETREGSTMEDFTARSGENDFYTVKSPGGTMNEAPQSYDASAYQPRIAPQEDQLQARSPQPQAAPADDTGVHVVKKGETLYRIAKNNNVTVDALKAANGKTNNNIYPGERLQLPGAQPASYSDGTLTARAPNSDGTYTVQKGDNLNAIADRFGTTAQAIVAANQLTSTNIYVNQKLQIPSIQARGSGVQPAQPAVPTSYNTQGTARAPSKQGEQLHRVRAGETVASIALKYGYTEERLRQINGMAPNAVAMIGQLVKVSDCDCPEEDTENSLQARSPYTSATNQPSMPQQPSSYNSVPAYRRDMMGSSNGNTRQNELSDGDAFGEETYSADNRRYYNTPDFTGRRQPEATQPEPPSSYSAYGARQPRDPGRAYPTQNEQLTPRSPYQPQSYNSSYSGRINEQPNRSRTVYIVKDGDTLFSIARKYGTTVQELRDLNNLARNEILIPYQKVYLN